MLRFRLRTLLIVLAVVPPVLAGIWFALPQLAWPALAMAPSFFVALVWAIFYWSVAQRR